MSYLYRLGIICQYISSTPEGQFEAVPGVLASATSPSDGLVQGQVQAKMQVITSRSQVNKAPISQRWSNQPETLDTIWL